MKILHTLAQLPSMTGSGIYFSVLVEGLKKKGHRNAVLHATQDAYVSSFHDDVINYSVKFKSSELPFSIAGMSDEMPYDSTVYSQMSDKMYEQWIKAFRDKLEFIKKDFDPDVIIAHHTFILTSLVCEIFSDKKVINISHSTDVRQIRKNPWIYERYMPKISEVDKCILVSAADKDTIVNILGIDETKVAVYGGGFRQDIFFAASANKERNTEDKIKILYVGKIASAKGIYELVQAFPMLNADYDDLEFHIVGNCSDEQREYIAGLSRGIDNIYIHPTMPQSALADMMRAMDIFVLPSYYEGLGLVNIEALACGMRVLTTRIEGLIYLLGDKINNSGFIEYLKLPGLYNVDMVVEEEKEDYIRRLYKGMSNHIEAIKGGKCMPSDLLDEIASFSWQSIIDKFDEDIKG